MSKTPRFVPQEEDPLLSMVPPQCSAGKPAQRQKWKVPSRVVISDPIDNETTGMRRKKAPNWSPEEASTLLHALMAERTKLRAKHAGDGGTEQERQDAWVIVYDKVNAISRYGRSLEACQRKSSHFVSETRLKYLRLKKQVSQTGGGSIDPLDLLKSHEQLALEYGGMTMTRGLLGVPDLFKTNKWAASTSETSATCEKPSTSEKQSTSETSSKCETPPPKRRRQPTATTTREEAETETGHLQKCIDYVASGADSECNEDLSSSLVASVQSEEPLENGTSQSDAKSHIDMSDSISYIDDNDQDFDWEMPAGALKSDYDSSEYESPKKIAKTSSVKFSTTAKARSSALANLMPQNKHNMKKNEKIEAQIKVEDQARALALYQLTQERANKKKKALLKERTHGEQADCDVTKKHSQHEENVEAGDVDVSPGLKTTSNCTCSEVFSSLLQRVISVEEKLVENDEQKGEAIKQISHALTLLSCVVVNGHSQTVGNDDNYGDTDDDNMTLGTCDGQLVTNVLPGTSVKVVDVDGEHVSTVVVKEKTPPPLDLSTPTHRQVNYGASTSTAGTPYVEKQRSNKKKKSTSATKTPEKDAKVKERRQVDSKRGRHEEQFNPPTTRSKRSSKK